MKNLDEKSKKIIVESFGIAIAILIIVVGFLLILFTLSWFDWFMAGRSVVEDWLYTLKWIFVIIGIITIIYGIKRIIQNVII